MTPYEYKTFREVHGHGSHRVYKAFEEGEEDKYVTINEVIDYAIACEREACAKVAECWFSFDKSDETGKRIASSIRSRLG